MPSPKMGEAGRRRVISGIALAAALAGIAVLVVFLVAQTEPPTATTSSNTTRSTSPTDGSSKNAGDNGDRAGQSKRESKGQAEQKTEKQPDPLPASKPTSISLPAIDVKSDVIGIGKNPDGTLGVPEGDNINKAAWYKQSPTPGQTGPSVIEGHIDTVDGPSVFYRLGALESGDKVKVTRADDSRVEFTVTEVRAYPTKDAFPTELVYGGDVSEPSLRLITCSNFDESIGHYAGNTVVYAELSGVQRAE